MNLQTLTADFHGTAVNIIDHAGRKWLTSEQVGLCLGYAEANARQGIGNLFKRHEDEFTAADTCVIKLMTQGGFVIKLMTNPKGGNPTTRIFSDTGCIKLGFFSNTTRAKDFRHWASQVLAGRDVSPGAPIPQVTATGRKPAVTRVMELEVLNLFVSGLSQKSISKRIGVSLSAVNLILHGRYRFSPGAGQDLTTPELIAAVTHRHITADIERLTRKYCASAANQHLENALDSAGYRLLTGIADASNPNKNNSAA